MITFNDISNKETRTTVTIRIILKELAQLKKTALNPNIKQTPQQYLAEIET